MKNADIFRLQRKGLEPVRVVDGQDIQAIPLDIQRPLDIQTGHPGKPVFQDIQDVQKALDGLDVQESQRVPRSRVGKALLTSRQPVQRLERFDFTCHSKGLDKQEVIGALLDAWMDGRVVLDVQAVQHSRTSNPALLMIDDAESLDIINHYARWTSNEPKQADVDLLPELRKRPTLAVKCGILMSVLRAKGRINSLRYCLGAIEEAAASNANLQEYLGYLEHKAKRAGKGGKGT